MKIQYKLADLFGYDLISKEKSFLFPERHLCDLIERYSVHSLWLLDVGANEGQFGKKMRKAGYQGMIYSFEPVKSAYQKLLKASEGDPNWKVFNLALGDKEQVAQINTPTKSTVFSSLLSNNKYSEERFGKFFCEVTKEEVSVKELDKFVGTEALSDIPKFDHIILKLDTQGFDLNVLKGSVNLLSKVDIILTELSFVPIYHGMPDFIENSTFLKAHGFTPTAFFPVSRDKKSMGIIEMDGVFIKSRI